jgi:hypothetical protein
MKVTICSNPLCVNMIDRDTGVFSRLSVKGKEFCSHDCLKTLDDAINPNHYKIGGIEFWDYAKAKLTKEELIGACKFMIIKYISREAHKNGLEDIKKLSWYTEKLIELQEENV